MKTILAYCAPCILTLTLLLVYPIDGFERTGIKRLKYLERVQKDEVKTNRNIPAGALKSWRDIELNLLERAEDSLAVLMRPDSALQARIGKLFRGMDRSYSITLLDISNPYQTRYASRNPTLGYQPGSVGKLAVLLALFDQLSKLFPEDFEARLELLKNREVRAGVWGLTDEHTIPIYNPDKETLVKRQVVASDVFSLFEWADHMLSVSNNGAASIVWREALLMSAFGSEYPSLSETDAETYFKTTPRAELTDKAMSIVNEPLRQLGISSEEWRLGRFFTRGANTYVGDKGGSIGTPEGLMKFLVLLEQGKAVDPASSLEMKRLMYMTDRRIRYAQAPSLAEAAVYFKSGSLYKCDRSQGEECGKYMGNELNYMNSVILVEHPDNCKYIVVLMSNVLRKNSASDHMALAGSIDRVIRGN